MTTLVRNRYDRCALIFCNPEEARPNSMITQAIQPIPLSKALSLSRHLEGWKQAKNGEGILNVGSALIGSIAEILS